MPRQVLITLSDQAAAFVDSQIATGIFASPEDVVRAGVHLLQHEAKVKALRAALDEGEASGLITDFDFDTFLAEKNREHAAKNRSLD